MKNFHFPPKEDTKLFGATEYSVSPFLVGGCSIPKGLCTLHSSSYCRKKVVALNMPAVCATCILRMSMLVATLPITYSTIPKQYWPSISLVTHPFCTFAKQLRRCCYYVWDHSTPKRRCGHFKEDCMWSDFEANPTWEFIHLVRYCWTTKSPLIKSN